MQLLISRQSSIRESNAHYIISPHHTDRSEHTSQREFELATDLVSNVTISKEEYDLLVSPSPKKDSNRESAMFFVQPLYDSKRAPHSSH